MKKLSTLGIFLGIFLYSSLGFSSTYSSLMKSANKEYNKGRYQISVKIYRKAIQEDPEQSEAYRNLARAYFWMEKYSSALAYYDFYLSVSNIPKDADRIRKERALAKNRAGESVYKRTKSQRKILKALGGKLKRGRIYTQGDGGAFGMYRDLLHTGFAEPKLSDIRSQLSRRLIDEFDVEMLPKPGQFIPILESNFLKTQVSRLNALRSVTHDKVILDIVNRRTKIIDAMNFMIVKDFDKASLSFQEAQRLNPDIAFLQWWVVSNLIHTNKTDLALAEISILARKLKNSNPQALYYIRLLRAIALQKNGRIDDASEIFIDIFESDTLEKQLPKALEK